MSSRTLSTTASRTYWLGRYLERAGSITRLVSVNANLLMDLPTKLQLGWLPLVEILANQDTYQALYGASGGDAKVISPSSYEKSVTRFLLSDTRNPGSLISVLTYARANARTLRGTLPRAAYEHINDAHSYAKESIQEPLSRTRRSNALQHVVERLQHIDGFLSATMLHDASWQFLRLGNFIERADMTTRIIDLRSSNLLSAQSALAPFSDIQWRSILNSLDAMQGYFISQQNPINQSDVLEFLLKNSELPRSLLRCFSTIRNCLRSLPRNTEPLKLINSMRQQLQRARVHNLKNEKLHRYVGARQKQLSTLHQKITHTYFPDA
ncbi:MAG: alpha-E domain-containing protein [Gammaproteobacteria bacterium]|nr:alpha-E domain-containing protein [Gammaproteobacteria bacterium]